MRVAIMHLGKVAAIGTPDELKAGIGGDEVTLGDVFVHYAGIPWNQEEAIVKLQERGAPFGGLASAAPPQRADLPTRLVLFVAKTLAIVAMECSIRAGTGGVRSWCP